MTLATPSRRFLLAALALSAVIGLPDRTTRAQSSTLVPAGAIWKYLDNGSNQGTAWRATAFNDSTWASGPAQLGYGDGDETTSVSFGPNSSAKYITTYFRHTFTVVSPASYQSLILRVIRDDGVVVYLNGTEVFRSNMPTGGVTSSTLASSAIGGADESAWQQTTVSPALLVAGTNVLAVEVHQSGGTSSDLSFALELTAGSGVSLTRAPYLQLGTPSSVVVRWRTSAPAASRVAYGPAPDALGTTVSDPTLRTEHAVTLAGLLSDTTYCYAVGTATATLAGGDAGHCFTTSPLAGTPKATRIWVLGDSGTADASARAVRDAYYAWTGARKTDLWLMLGDNAYQNGTDSEFQAAVFNMYPATLRSSVLWPTLGNHDGYTADSASGTGPYYDIFTLPRAGEAGGLPSGTEAYYSFDYGNIHFVSLESFETDRSPTGAMLTWLREDLAATSQPWLIVFFHHPPYTKGSHNSDTEIELVEMRQNALPILEDAGVDLVLTGHSHSYERSFLIDGHYGTSNTFTAGMKVDGGSGRENETGAYRKPHGLAPHAGAIYAVAGSSGKISGGTLNHPAMFVSLNSLGSMALDIDDDRLDAVFLDGAGAVRDRFTILKGSAPTAAPAAPTNLAARARSATIIDLTWADNATTETGYLVERSTNGTSFSTVATLAANVTAYADTGLARNRLYYYRVRAAAGTPPVYSAYSNTASARTPKK